ncbi:MAG: hypothetical protein GSR79_04180, partial [Desulfurococcales archaeon]|nr:hypothetical protein [Desulfurococcales archaeon]
MNKITSTIVIALLLIIFIPYTTPYTFAANNNSTGGQGLNMNITAKLYRDGYVRVKGIIPGQGGASTQSFNVVYNYTFYKDKTIKEESITQTTQQQQPTPANQYIEVNLTGTRNNGNLTGVMNMTRLLQTLGTSYTNVVMYYNVAYGKSNWTLVALYEINTNDTTVVNSLKNITANQFLPYNGARILNFNTSITGGKYAIKITAVIPYNPAPSNTPYISDYISVMGLISQNRTLEINSYTYISSTGSMESKQRVVYMGGYKDHLKAYVKQVRYLSHLQEAQGMQSNNSTEPLLQTIEQLADKFEVKEGSSFTQVITPQATTITTPLIREKGVTDPIETLVALRDILLSMAKTGQADFNTTQVLNQKITLQPGDQNIKKIQPNQTILGNLEQVKINPETPRNNTLIIGGITAAIAAIIIIAIYLMR